MYHNPNCDGAGPCAVGEIRVLPMGGGSNGLLCRQCFYKEIAYRQDRNRTLEEQNKFTLPTWDELEVYEC